MCGTPKPDPQIGQAALRNAGIGERQQQLAEQEAARAREELDFQKTEWAKLQPKYEQMMNDAIAASKLDRERSAASWDIYNDTFRPIEERFASESMNYDSPEEVARREGLASATAQRQIDTQRGQTTRELARMGVSADRAGAAMQDDATGLALAQAGAINSERTNTKLLGMQMRQDAANFGRGQAQLGLATGQAALSQASGAQGAAANNQGLRVSGQGMVTGINQSGNAFSNSAVSANNSAASILNEQYKSQVQAAGDKMKFIGQMAGAGASMMMGSDENTKENIAPINPEAALEGLRKVPVSEWNYKPGEGDGGAHVGPMAQDVNAQFGESAAPGGTQIDLISENGIKTAAIQALADKVDGLTAIVMAGKKRPSRAKPRAIPMIGLEAI